MGDDGPSEQQFDRIVERSEALARLPVPELPPDEFDELVTAAIDDLPAEFRDLLETTPVVISRRGREYHAYGHYIGDTVARDDHPDRIIIYRDTLERDFGHDPDLLRAQVTRTLRHELAHHLGWNETGVERLGLLRATTAGRRRPGESGEGGIRTLETGQPRPRDFQSRSLSHSDTSPGGPSG